jgi:hypothetical protein
MPVTLQQYNNIKAFLKGNPEGSYENWFNQYKPKKEKVNKEYSEEFEAWWSIYPTTATFDFNGVKFRATRILREDKATTYRCYEEAKKKHNVTDSQLLHALKVEVQQRKDATWKRYQKTHSLDYSDFQYMKASAAYLNSGRFNYYIDEKLEENTQDTTPVQAFNSIDI